MSLVVYKCPNCGSNLTFRPDKQSFSCEYCRSNFTEAKLAARQTANTDNDASPEETSASDTNFERQIASYLCPTCGGEIVGEAAMAATACPYCHNPVILSDRLSGEWKPDKVIPFAFGKDDVQKRFMKWAKQHWFIDGTFHDKASVENLHGIYYPFWVVEGRAQGRMQATGQNVRSWRTGNTEYTETSCYDVTRAGDFAFNNLALKATNAQAARMVDGLYPYDASKLQDFSMPYLSGFLAEKRSIEKTALESKAKNLVSQAARTFLRKNISGYRSVAENDFSLTILDDKWRYALMPVWLLTYSYKGQNYFFAMNGQTGKTAGRVPVSRKKLGVLFFIVSIAVSAFAIVASAGGAQ